MRKSNNFKFKNKLIVNFISIILVIAVCTAVVLLASQTSIIVEGNINYEDIELQEIKLAELEGAPELDGFVAVTQSLSHIMYISPETTNIALYNKEDKSIVFTHIPDDKIEESKAKNSLIKSYMQSNIIMTSVNIDSGVEKEYNSKGDSVDKGNYGIINIPDGVRVTYVFGKIPKEQVVPSVMEEELFNEIIERAGSNEREIKSRYTKIDTSTIKDSKQKNEYIAKYPISKDKIIYVLRPNLQEFILDKLEAIFEEIGFTMDDKHKAESIIAGTREQETYDAFKIPLDFTLKNSMMSVSIDKTQIRHGPDSYPSKINLLPYFLSADENESGYIVLPDGCGSIINLNNKRFNSPPYSVEIYGNDPVFPQILNKEKKLNASLPVFGLNSDNGIFAHISSSAAEAFVYADIAGKNSIYNHVFTGITLRSNRNEVVYHDWAAGAGTIFANRVQPGVLSGIFQVDYFMLPKNKSEYRDMAVLYRNILMSEKTLTKKENDTELLINILGAFDTVKSVAGIPRRENIPMTTYSRAAEIASFFHDKNISCDVRYLGGVNGGYRQTLSNKISHIPDLGNKSAFNELQKKISGQGGTVYWDISLTQVYENKIFDGFNVSRDTVSNIYYRHEKTYSPDPITFYMSEEPRYLLSPNKLKDISGTLANHMQKMEIKGIALRNMGKTIYSDCNIESPVFRAQSEEQYKVSMENLSGNAKLMCSGGNEYVFKWVNFLCDLPDRSNRYQITDASIPFYQMVICGYIPFTYSPLNLVSDPLDLALVSISTGAIPSLTLSFEDSGLLKQTDYNSFYSVNFAQNIEKMENILKRIYPAVKTISGKSIISYIMLSDGVSCTIFEDDIRLYVNRNDVAYDDGTISIPAKDWIIN